MSQPSQPVEPAVTAESGAVEYEFSASQNEKLRLLVKAMKGTSFFLSLCGLSSLLSAGHQIFAHGLALNEALIDIFYQVIMGGCLYVASGAISSAAGSFQAVESTEGSDITNLMSALDSLAVGFMFVRKATIGIAVFSLLYVGGGIGWGIYQRSSGATGATGGPLPATSASAGGH
jgi:hypothetical protein